MHVLMLHPNRRNHIMEEINKISQQKGVKVQKSDQTRD